MSNVAKFLAKNGIDNNNNTLSNVSAPSLGTDAANKTYVDTALSAKANSATTLAGYGIIDAAPLSHVSDATIHLTSAQNTWIDAITATAIEVNYLSGVTSSIQTQFSGKEPTISAGTTSQYYRGDKSWQTLDKSSVGLSNVTNNAQLVATQTLALTGDITATATLLSSGTIATTLANSGVSAGTYSKVTVNTKGLVTASGALNATDITTALTYTPVNIAGDTLTGFLTLHSDPTSAMHAVTKQYVDNAITGLDVKSSVRAISTSNITLSGTQTVDGVSLIAGDRILVAGQTTASQNGIYVVASGAWSRSEDANISTEVTSGMYTFVEEGSINADTGWILSTNNPIVLGTTSLSFTQFNGLGQITAGAGLTKTGSTLDIVTASTSRIVVNADNIDLAVVSQGAGTSFVKLTIDSYGRVSGNTAVAQSDITELLAANSLTETMISNGTLLARVADNETISGTWTFSNTISGSISGNSNTATTLATGRTIAMTGDVTWTSPTFNGSTNVTAAATLANSGVTAGTYSSVTVNAKGLVTAATTNVTLANGDLLSASLTTSTTTSNQVVTGVSSSTYRSIKVVAQISSGVSYQTTELLIVHNGTTPTISEYGSVYTGTSLGSFDADISGGSLRILVTPVNAVSTIKVIITAINV